LGSAGTLLANRNWVKDDSEFWVLYGDVLTTMNFDRMLAFHRSRPAAATLGLYQVEDPRRCGVAVFDEESVVQEFEEKPKQPRSKWAFAGILIATPELFDFIPAHTPADIGYDVLPHLIGRMRGYPITEFLLDIGTIDNYELAQGTWPGTQVNDVGSTIR